MRREVVRVRGLEFLLALELLLLRALRGGDAVDERVVRVVVFAEHVEERELPVLERVEVVGVDDRTMAAAPVESCRFLPERSPWGRLGSVLYTCNRLRRVRRRFKHFWSISLSRPLGLAIFYAFVASRAVREH